MTSGRTPWLLIKRIGLHVTEVYSWFLLLLLYARDTFVIQGNPDNRNQSVRKTKSCNCPDIPLYRRDLFYAVKNLFLTRRVAFILIFPLSGLRLCGFRCIKTWHSVQYIQFLLSDTTYLGHPEGMMVTILLRRHWKVLKSLNNVLIAKVVCSLPDKVWLSSFHFVMSDDFQMRCHDHDQVWMPWQWWQRTVKPCHVTCLLYSSV